MYDLEDFAYNSVNITSFRLIEHSDQNLKAIEDMQRFNAKSYSKVLQVSQSVVSSSLVLLTRNPPLLTLLSVLVE